MQVNNQNVEELIYHYGMIPEFIEQHGRVWRVATKNGAFALKQIKKSMPIPCFGISTPFSSADLKP